jgi:AraC-like DNA-binding protein
MRYKHCLFLVFSKMTSAQINESSVIELLVREDQYLGIAGNSNDEDICLRQTLQGHLVHFYFGLEGAAHFEFSPHYQRELCQGRNYFLFDPSREISFLLRLKSRCRLVLLSVTLEGLHQLFIDDPHELKFLRAESTHHKFYDEKQIPASLLLVLTQLFNKQLSENAQKLFYQGKVLEILSEYFSSRKPDTESCPFLNDESVIKKLKHAKDYVLENLSSPPRLKVISRTAGLNEHQLKVGFKELYGTTVYQYITHHRLDHARLLLDSRQYSVKEVAYQIGYTNTSHFIASFKRRFGITPKQYLKRSHS